MALKFSDLTQCGRLRSPGLRCKETHSQFCPRSLFPPLLVAVSSAALCPAQDGTPRACLPLAAMRCGLHGNSIWHGPSCILKHAAWAAIHGALGASSFTQSPFFMPCYLPRLVALQAWEATHRHAGTRWHRSSSRGTCFYRKLVAMDPRESGFRQEAQGLGLGCKQQAQVRCLDAV